MALAHPGKAQEQLRKEGGPGYIVAAVGSLVTAYVLGYFLNVTFALTLGDALLTAFLAWLGFVATSLAVNYAFAQNPWKLYAIDASYFLVGLLAMAVVFTFMP